MYMDPRSLQVEGETDVWRVIMADVALAVLSRFLAA